MPTVKFYGRILPSVCKVTLALDPSTTLNWIDEERQNSFAFKINISNSDIRVECAATHYDKSQFDEVYRRAFDLARAAVDVVAFGAGWGLTVVFDKFEDQTGATSELMIHDPSLPPLVTAFQIGGPLPNNLQETLHLVWTEPALFFAFRDLIEAITLPHRASVCCARAVEGLRNLIAVQGQARGQAWAEFNRALQLEASYTKLITANSVGTRHGDHERISGEVTKEITRRSWTIMDRFLRYRLGGNKPLDAKQFPLLSE
jgi:hypothetical protein